MTANGLLLFLRSLAAEPRMVGAVVPSGSALANLITQDINGATGKVLELGPGTGVLTAALLQRGVRESDLTLIEYGSDFMRLLQQRFPHARVLWMDAAWISPQKLFAPETFGAVVSGLPLLNIAEQKVDAILSGVFASLKPGGAMYQFTYGVRCPISHSQLERHGLQASCAGRVLMNVPPASVYRISRRPARQASE
ncbi:methyltransferase domain-containing protein [Rhodopseudomonas boonkerdii]|uniref:class I SAM-dependent methyltransferase n=1 Tax=Rhodopseudomonas boonkerdii TaxID=475937 RepID=UPI001E325F82|nr:methyltransferase domain-containing protein [Rhodopseudomonas boonkerdii]UGV26763.1 methyltransferase domain-containing protein [Rhodopseudomonas boonkerdii]